MYDPLKVEGNPQKLIGLLTITASSKVLGEHYYAIISRDTQKLRSAPENFPVLKEEIAAGIDRLLMEPRKEVSGYRHFYCYLTPSPNDKPVEVSPSNSLEVYRERDVSDKGDFLKLVVEDAHGYLSVYESQQK